MRRISCPACSGVPGLKLAGTFRRLHYGRVVRLATWNCRAGGLAKWSALEALEVDVAVLCEASLADPSSTPFLFGSTPSWVGAGDPNKAVVIASRGPLEERPGRRDQGRFTVAAKTEAGLTVIGIYVNPLPRGSGDRCEDEVLATLAAWAEEIRGGDVVVAGDLNIGHAIGHKTEKPWISRAHAAWTDLGLVSAYHHSYDVELGAETHGTHFHQYRAEAGWHIDFVLVPSTRLADLRSVQVGDYATWTAAGATARSDHVPMIIELKI